MRIQSEAKYTTVIAVVGTMDSKSLNVFQNDISRPYKITDDEGGAVKIID